MDAQEVRDVLEAIERGEVTLEPQGQTADEVYAGNVTYRASNGWTLAVFNDCGDWDYLDSVIAPDGRSAEYPSGLDPFESELHDLFVSYDPPPEVVRTAYGFS